MFEKLIDFIFKKTAIFYYFRIFVHNNFIKEKNILKKELDIKKKTLDFGCGIGQYSYLFDDYLGVDINEDNINFAKRKFHKNFKLISNISDVKNIKFYQIFSSMVIHHISDKELINIFVNFYKLLNKNGKLLIIDYPEIKFQPNIIGKFILLNDRGKYFRNIDKLKFFFDKYFKINKLYYYKTGPFKAYVLILAKK